MGFRVTPRYMMLASIAACATAGCAVVLIACARDQSQLAWVSAPPPKPGLAPLAVARLTQVHGFGNLVHCQWCLIGPRELGAAMVLMRSVLALRFAFGFLGTSGDPQREILG